MAIAMLYDTHVHYSEKEKGANVKEAQKTRDLQVNILPWRIGLAPFFCPRSAITQLIR